MFSILLVIIYAAFVSMGLPDSMLGAAWPVMQGDLSAPISYAGIISMIISCGTVISGLASDALTRKFGAGKVTAVSVGLSALSLFGFSISGNFAALCLWAVPYGLSAGSIDAALNNYVALHYAARHMSWLHCFWGVGTSVSPYIMSMCLASRFGWRGGYRAVSVIQIVLTVCIVLSLPLWKRRTEEERNGGDESKPLGIKGALRIKGVPYVLCAFFGYCALETTAGLWASSYLVEIKGTDPIIAARFASLFYIGITVGRFINGFSAEKLGDRRSTRAGIIIGLFGILLIMLPLKTDIAALAGLIITGLGCAPIYPSIIHSTPSNFGRENSQAIVGIQMASAYVGSTLMPPLFGVIASNISISLYPFYLAVFSILMLVMTEGLWGAVRSE